MVVIVQEKKNILVLTYNVLLLKFLKYSPLKEAIKTLECCFQASLVMTLARPYMTKG